MEQAKSRINTLQGVCAELDQTCNEYEILWEELHLILQKRKPRRHRSKANFNENFQKVKPAFRRTESSGLTMARPSDVHETLIQHQRSQKNCIAGSNLQYKAEWPAKYFDTAVSAKRQVPENNKVTVAGLQMSDISLSSVGLFDPDMSAVPSSYADSTRSSPLSSGRSWRSCCLTPSPVVSAASCESKCSSSRMSDARSSDYVMDASVSSSIATPSSSHPPHLAPSSSSSHSQSSYLNNTARWNTASSPDEPRSVPATDANLASTDWRLAAADLMVRDVPPRDVTSTGDYGLQLVGPAGDVEGDVAGDMKREVEGDMQGRSPSIAETLRAMRLCSERITSLIHCNKAVVRCSLDYVHSMSPSMSPLSASAPAHPSLPPAPPHVARAYATAHMPPVAAAETPVPGTATAAGEDITVAVASSAAAAAAARSCKVIRPGGGGTSAPSVPPWAWRRTALGDVPLDLALQHVAAAPSLPGPRTPSSARGVGSVPLSAGAASLQSADKVAVVGDGRWARDGGADKENAALNAGGVGGRWGHGGRVWSIVI